MNSLRVIAVAFTGFATTLPLSAPLHAEQVGKVSQPIIAGDAVSVARQRQLGLVIVGGGCSGTLLNRFWVLTASHCVSTDGTEGGPDQPFKDTLITAYWTHKSATPTRYVRYWGSNGLDVALIFLGRGDLGPVDRKLIYHAEVDDSMTLTKFGIGYCAYASGSGEDAKPAKEDCGYRSMRYAPAEANAVAIQYRPNAGGQIASFGDSGGPDFVIDGYGNPFAIAGVTSTGRARFLPGKEGTEWVSEDRSGTSAALYTIRDDIHRHMKEVPPRSVTKPIDNDIVTRDSGVAAKSPSSYGGVMMSPGVGMATKRPSSYGGAIVAGGGQAPPALPYGPGTCRSGFVWREAAPTDLVCVPPEARDRVAEENATAAERWRGGAESRHGCKRAYVYREAYLGDDVCVTPESYDLVAEENAEGPNRRAQQ